MIQINDNNENNIEEQRAALVDLAGSGSETAVESDVEQFARLPINK